jgi:beta-lactam-binding protein with PASTA domain
VPTAALAIVAVTIALFALFKPSTPTVPVIGPVDQATAVQLLKNAHYEPDLINLPNNDIAQGLAVKTDPAGGSALPQGEHVKLYISAGKCQGPCPVEVPIVEGLSVNEAQAKLQDAKFTVRLIRAPSDLPVDQVITSDRRRRRCGRRVPRSR